MSPTLTIVFIVFLFTLVFMTGGTGGSVKEQPEAVPIRQVSSSKRRANFDPRGLAFESTRGRVPFDPSRGSKCFSCEAQDAAMGITRDYGSKCIDCENQDRAMGIYRGYGSKWY